MLHMVCFLSVFYLCDQQRYFTYHKSKIHSDAGNLKLQDGTLGPSLKTALKPNTDVLNELHYFIARCNGEAHTNMFNLPSEHSLPHGSHTHLLALPETRLQFLSIGPIPHCSSALCYSCKADGS